MLLNINKQTVDTRNIHSVTDITENDRDGYFDFFVDFFNDKKLVLTTRFIPEERKRSEVWIAYYAKIKKIYTTKEEAKCAIENAHKQILEYWDKSKSIIPHIEV